MCFEQSSKASIFPGTWCLLVQINCTSAFFHSTLWSVRLKGTAIIHWFTSSRRSRICLHEWLQRISTTHHREETSTSAAVDHRSTVIPDQTWQHLTTTRCHDNRLLRLTATDTHTSHQSFIHTLINDSWQSSIVIRRTSCDWRRPHRQSRPTGIWPLTSVTRTVVRAAQNPQL